MEAHPHEKPQTPQQQSSNHLQLQKADAPSFAENNQATRLFFLQRLLAFARSFNTFEIIKATSHWVQAATNMYPACPNKKLNYYSTLLRRRQSVRGASGRHSRGPLMASLFLLVFLDLVLAFFFPSNALWLPPGRFTCFQACCK